MVGTLPEGRGGVASVVSVLRRHGLFEREDVRYIATHRCGTRMAKAAGALGGLCRIVLSCLWAGLGRRPAVVHAHVASRASFLRKSLVLLIARMSGCKTIFHLHGAEFREFATQEAGRLLRRWIRHTLERSSVVIALSESWAQFLRAFAPGATVAVVPNAVPLPVLPAGADEADGTDGGGEAGRILFLGRVEAGKGVYELLAAGAALADRFPALRIVIGGEGDLEGVRRRAAALGIGARVELRGWIDAQARAAELARASVFCLPSHAEGLPMALLEAMAARKAVVACSVGGVPEALRDGDNGLLVAPRDSGALAAALGRVLGDRALRARLAQRARATVEQYYSTEVMCGKLSAIYRELAGTT
jgi:glycosyltransferase involved in cell wall biosynthesis